MSVSNLRHIAFTSITNAAAKPTVDDLLRDIQSDDDDVRTSAWLRAGDVGATAVEPLAALTAHESPEVARAAKRGLWQIVRHCGRPGAESEREAVSAALMQLLSDDRPVPLRRDVLWMLSESGGDDCVKPVAALISNGDLREDARMTLERIPGDASLAALKSALEAVPDDFKLNIAQSLRQRGVEVSGHPCAKLVPTKSTEVTPL
jgi:HEAT repeat protein